MGNWYRVVKTIKGHRYVYEQQTYREGSRVRTRNRYLGPAGSETQSSGSPAGKRDPSGGTTGIASAVVGGLAAFGKEAAQQFDAPRWGTDAATQLGLANGKFKRTKTTVTTTKHRPHPHQARSKVSLYDPQDLSPAGRIKTAAIEKVFSRIPDGTTEPQGYIVKRNGKLFPTAKLTADLQSYIGIELAGDGSIIEGINVNKIGFTEKIALHQIAKQSDKPVLSQVTTTNAASASRSPDASAHPPHVPLQSDAHRKYFINEMSG